MLIFHCEKGYRSKLYKNLQGAAVIVLLPQR